VGRARLAGLAALVGNALDRSVLDEARIEDATVMVALTANQEVNFLACQLAREEYQAPHVHPVLVDRERGPRDELVQGIGGEIAFAPQTDVTRWNHDLNEGLTSLATVKVGGDVAGRTIEEAGLEPDVLPLLVERDGEAQICHVGLRFAPDDELVALVREGAEERLRARLESPASELSEARA
jgi:Trk K+ transport system NAD-binding subunit